MARAAFTASVALAASMLPITATRAEQALDCPPPPDLRAVFADRAPGPAAPDTGMLWRLDKQGRRSYLHATSHVATAAFARPGPLVMRALRDADVLALELDITDPKVMKETRAVANDHPPPPRWTPDIRARIGAIAERACARAQVEAMAEAPLQLTTLMLLDARRAGLEIVFGRDLLLATLANRDGKPVVSLETATVQMGVLAAMGDPMRPERQLAPIEDGSTQRVMRKTVNAWATGDLARLDDIASWCECVADDASRRAFGSANDARNPGLAEGIARLHDQGKSVLAAIGALHMTGPQAVQKLLVERGFEVERLH